jgi:hypothetical protein
MKYPPIEFEGGFIIGMREPQGVTIVVALPNQDSYEMFPEEFEMWLSKMGVPAEVGFLEYLWNFYSAKLLLNGDFRIEPLSMEQVEAFVKRPSTVTF